MTELSLDDPALVKLKNMMGEPAARTLIHEVFKELGVSNLDDADDRLRFGQALVPRGGVFEAIGRSIKVQALLHGANAAAA
ncbi:MAG: hypothetical protein Q8O67_26975 [Deltaproteobacteria bacterium]|nr:hypothetical protein [Deltaproteobacteria bacterium]